MSLTIHKIYKYEKPKWVVFNKQYDALKYAKLKGETSFSFESSKNDRKFLVTSRSRFWSQYQKTKRKNHYEIIPPDVECKLFLDLEFLKKCNQEKNGQEMTEHLLCKIIMILNHEFDLQISRDHCVVMESCSKEKYSSHVIFNGFCFQNISQTGQFVEYILNKFSEDEKILFSVNDKYGNNVPYIDTSVYNRNRQFRIIFSSKFGQVRIIDKLYRI